MRLALRHSQNGYCRLPLASIPGSSRDCLRECAHTCPSLGQAMLMILDGVQPVGATTVVLDQNHITAGLGVAAALNSVLAVRFWIRML